MRSASERRIRRDRAEQEERGTVPYKDLYEALLGQCLGVEQELARLRQHLMDFPLEPESMPEHVRETSYRRGWANAAVAARSILLR